MSPLESAASHLLPTKLPAPTHFSRQALTEHPALGITDRARKAPTAHAKPSTHQRHASQSPGLLAALSRHAVPPRAVTQARLPWIDGPLYGIT